MMRPVNGRSPWSRSSRRKLSSIVQIVNIINMSKEHRERIPTRILIVDDMESMRQIIKLQLHNAGFTNVVEAKDGQEAYIELAKARKNKAPIELILADWNMPTMNGFELLQAIRNNPEYKNLPFIMITAENEQEKVLLAIQNGIDNYVVKPIVEKDLVQRVQSAFTRHKIKK